MAHEPPAVSSTVGPWLILERLDSSSFGVVFLAPRAGHAMPTEDGNRDSSAPESEERRHLRPTLPAWFTWASASMVGGLVVALVLVLVLRVAPAAP